MKTIWKFTFDAQRVPVDEPYFFDIEMPRDARLLHVDVQIRQSRRNDSLIPEPTDVPCLWAFVSPDAEKEYRMFMLVGTGHSIPDLPLTHVGTFKTDQDRQVYHLFETRRRYDIRTA